MNKLLKRFLIISQVLGWSALMATACTDDTKTNNTSVENKSKTTEETKDTNVMKSDANSPTTTESSPAISGHQTGKETDKVMSGTNSSPSSVPQSKPEKEATEGNTHSSNSVVTEGNKESSKETLPSKETKTKHEITAAEAFILC